jgi:hypothetical protein
VKTISLITKVAAVALMVVGLGACGKKSSKNSVAAVTAGYTTCTTGINPYTQQPCQIGTTIYGGGAQQQCMMNAYGQYTYPGTMTPCQPGMNTGFNNGMYGQTGCEQANAMYPGHYYTPVMGPQGPICQLVY